MDILAQRLKMLREHKSWSQPELERWSGVGQSHISRIEQGKAPNTSGVVVAKLANALDTTADYLLGRTDDPDPRPPPNPPDLADPRLRRIIDNWPELSEAMKESFNLQIDAFFAEGQRRR